MNHLQLCELGSMILKKFCLFVYGLFNNTFGNSGSIVPNERMVVNNELEWLWNEGSVVWFKAMSWPERTEETSVRILSVLAEIHTHTSQHGSVTA